MREADILKALQKRLSELLPQAKVRWVIEPHLNGGKRPDAVADLRIAGNRLKLVFELVGQPNQSRLRDKCIQVKAYARNMEKAIPALAAPHLNEDMRRLCIDEGVRYVDLSGNVWLEEGPIIIKMEAAKNLFPHEAKERSPFADKASLVLRYLIGQPEPAGIRKIAGAVGLDPGYVSRVVRSASDLGYALIDDRGQARLRNIPEMLSDWSAAYSWRRNELQSFFWLGKSDSLPEVMNRELKRWPEESYALSLHAGNNLIEPFASYDSYHVYAVDESAEQRIRAIQGVGEAPPNAGNIVLMKPHYAKSAFYGARSVKGLRVVSDVQLYLDLHRFPVRGDEASEHILENRLRPLWEKR